MTATKTETFFLDSKEDVLLFLEKCKEEGIYAEALAVKTEDGRVIYPVKVKYNFTNHAIED